MFICAPGEVSLMRLLQEKLENIEKNVQGL